MPSRSFGRAYCIAGILTRQSDQESFRELDVADDVFDLTAASANMRVVVIEAIPRRKRKAMVLIQAGSANPAKLRFDVTIFEHDMSTPVSRRFLVGS